MKYWRASHIKVSKHVRIHAQTRTHARTCTQYKHESISDLLNAGDFSHRHDRMVVRTRFIFIHDFPSTPFFVPLFLLFEGS